MNGAPERIRTSGLCLRRAALYPAELRVHLVFYSLARMGPQRQNEQDGLKPILRKQIMTQLERINQNVDLFTRVVHRE